MEKLLTICIPTYNRCEKLMPLVDSILSCNSSEIEVVVLDNCSNDDTHKKLSKITDNRLIYICNNKNIGGIANPIKALTYAKGKYSMLLLDKDYMYGKYLPCFLEELRKQDIDIGYCRLNVENEEDNIVVDPENSILKIGLNECHPSGRFCKTELYKKESQVYSPDIYDFAFQIDVIFAYIARGRSGFIYGKKLINTETREECLKVKSHSYKSKKDCFFTYFNRTSQYKKYICHVKNLHIDGDKYRLLSELYNQGLYKSTFEYKRLMKDNVICQHYNVDTENIKNIFLLYIFVYYNLHVLPIICKENSLKVCLSIGCHQGFSCLRKIINEIRK